MTIINPRNINNATNAVSTLDTPELRKKAYISQLSVDIVSEYLEQAGISVNTRQSFFKNLLLLNEFSFADLYAQNVRIDVRTLIGSDYSQMWVPKSHFTFGLTPDIYLGLRISQDIREADMLGFIEADKINRFSGKNREFVIVETEQLIPLSELTSYVKKFEKKKNSFNKASHEKVRDLFFAYIDGEIEKQDKIYLLKHIAKCEACAEEFNTCLGFDKNFRSIRRIPGFLIDLPFEKPSNAIEALEDSIKANNPINIIAAGAVAEQSLDVIYNTAAEAIDTNILLDRIKKAIADGNIEQISGKKAKPQDNQVDEGLSFEEPENELLEEIFEAQDIKGRKRKRLSRKFKKAARIIKNVLYPARKTKSEPESDINMSEDSMQGYTDVDNQEFENEKFEDYSVSGVLESNEKADFNLEGKVNSFDELFADVSDEDLMGFSEISEPDNSYEEDAVIDEVAPISEFEYELSQLDSINGLDGSNENDDDFEEVGNLEDYLSGKVLENPVLDDGLESDGQESDGQENVPKIDLIVDTDKQEAIDTLYPAGNSQNDEKIFKNLAKKLREENFGDDNFEVRELTPGEIQDVNLNLNEFEFKAEDLEGSIKDTETLQDLLGIKGFEFNEEKVKELSEKLADQVKEDKSSNIWNGNAELDGKIKEILETLDDVEIIENLQELSKLSGNRENNFDNNSNPDETHQENAPKLPQEFVNLEQIVKNDNKKMDKKTPTKERCNNSGLIAAAAVITAAGVMTYICMNALKPAEQAANINNNSINIAQNPQPVNNEPVRAEQNTQPHPEPRVVKQEEQQIPLAEIKNKKMTELARNRNINDVLANAFINQGNEIKITNISWEIKPSLASQATFKNYLMVTGQVLKMSLSKNLLAANDRAISNKVKVKVVLAPNGGIQESVIKETSGSKQIDEIVLITLKETFAYTKMPVNLNIKDPVTTNVIISL